MSLEWVTATPDTWLNRLVGRIKNRPCKLAQEVFKLAVMRTPARTGQLRASWNLSRDVPNYSTVDVGGAPGIPLQPPATPKCSERAATYVVANGKSYAGYVENGSPTTEPKKMLARAVAEASAKSGL